MANDSDPTTPLLVDPTNTSPPDGHVIKPLETSITFLYKFPRLLQEFIAQCLPKRDRITFSLRGLFLGCFIDNVASGFLTGAFETLISPSMRFAQVTGLKPNVILLAGAVFDAGAKPILALLKTCYGGRVVIGYALPILGAGYILTGLSISPWMLLISQALSGFGDSTFDLLPNLVITDCLLPSDLGVWRFWIMVVDGFGETIGGGLYSFIATEEDRGCEMLPELDIWARYQTTLNRQRSWRIPLAVIGILMIFLCWEFRFRVPPQNASTPECRTSNKWNVSAGLSVLVAVVATLLAINIADSRNLEGYERQHLSGRRLYLVIAISTVALCSFLILAIIEWRLDPPTFPWKAYFKPKMFVMTISLGASLLAFNMVMYRIASYTKARKMERRSERAPDWTLMGISLGYLTGSCVAGFLIRKCQRVKFILSGAILVSSAIYCLLARSTLAPERKSHGLAFVLLGSCAAVVDQFLVVAFFHIALGNQANERRRLAEKDLLFALFSLAVNLIRDVGISIASEIYDLQMIETLQQILPASDKKQSIIGALMEDLDCVKHVPDELKEKVLDCLCVGREKAFGFAAVLVLGALVAIPILPNTLRNNDESSTSTDPSEEDGSVRDI